MGSKVFAFGDIAGPVQFGKPAVLKKGHPPGAHRASGLRIGLAAVPRLPRHPAQPFEGNAGRQHGHRQDGHQRHVDTGMGQRIGRGRLAPGNYARVRARLGGRRATRRATRHGTGLVLLIAARRGAVRSGLRDDSTAGGSSERPSTVARMVPVRLFLFARVADCCATCRCCRDTCLKPSAWLSSLCSREPPVLSARAICRRAHHRRLHQRFEPYRHRDLRFQQSHG